MANRKRNIQMKFYVTEDEKRLIDEKMSQLPTRRYGAYLRKMAIDGYIIYASTSKQGTTLNSCCFFKHHTDKNKPPTTPTNPNQSHPPVGNE